MPEAATIERFTLDEVSPELLTPLQALYATAYHDTHMYEDLLDDIGQRPDVFQLFVARLNDEPHKIVGARVIESKPHAFIDYLGYEPVHGKRFAVLPDFRSRGIGKQMLDAGKQYCFEELGIGAIFGESNEIGALAMYGREGALYLRSSIEKALRRNSPEQNLKFFAEFVTNRALRGLRYPVGHGIQFVYCSDDQTGQFFRDHGYISKAELLGDASLSPLVSSQKEPSQQPAPATR